MAQIEVKVPQLSESVAEATLLQWHKKVGDAVARDENLVDIETDKVVLELPAPSAGVLTDIKKGDGATVVADELIAIIDTEATAGAAAPKAAATAQAPAAPRKTRRRRVAVSTGIVEPDAAPTPVVIDLPARAEVSVPAVPTKSTDDIALPEASDQPRVKRRRRAASTGIVDAG